MLNGKRLLAALIDYTLCIFIPSVAITPIQFIVGLENITQKQNLLIQIILFLLIFLVCCIFKDFIFKNQSLGKKAMNIKIVKVDEGSLTLGAALLRAIPLILVPIELIMIITQEKRLGDYLAKTKVVSEKTGDGSVS